MVVLLFIAFVVVPIVELAVVIQVGQIIGVWSTIALLLAVSVGGAWLVKRKGVGVWHRSRRRPQRYPALIRAIGPRRGLFCKSNGSGEPVTARSGPGGGCW